MLFLSRIHERKGADLLAAFNKVKKKVGFPLILVVGPDEGYLETLRSLARELKVEDNARFPGPPINATT